MFSTPHPMPRRAILLLCALLLPACGTDYAEIANIGTANTGIVCLGDSITHGYGATRGNTYPELLARRLGRPVVNAGVNGDTTADALRRLEEDVLALTPRVVIVFLGGNDVLQKMDRETTLSNLDTIVQRCLASGAMVVLVHARYGLFGDPYRDGFRDIAKRHNVLLVEGALDGILGNPSRSSDQIHPNNAGYALIAERVGDALVPLLQAANE